MEETFYIDPRRYHGRPIRSTGPASCADPIDRTPQELACYDLLDSLGILYDRVDHSHADTIEACHAVEQVLGWPVCKNLFLCNRQKTQYYLLMLEGDKVFKTKDLSAQIGSARLSFVTEYICPLFLIEAREADKARVLFDTLYRALDQPAGEPEPMLNLVAWYEAGGWHLCIFPRTRHRPSCYQAEGDANILLSPASVDLGGVFITPLEKDFEKIKAGYLQQILAEVCTNREQLVAIINRLNRQQS